MAVATKIIDMAEGNKTWAWESHQSWNDSVLYQVCGLGEVTAVSHSSISCLLPTFVTASKPYISRICLFLLVSSPIY